MAGNYRLFSLEEFKERLYISVLNYSENQKMLTDVPFERKGEYALTARVFLGEKDDNGFYPESAIVNDALLLEMGMDIDSCINFAKNNSKKLFPGEIRNVEDYLDQGFEDWIAPDGVGIPQVYLLTNIAGLEEHAPLFYQPELIENLSSMLEKNLLILPLDNALMYCIPVSNQEQIDAFSTMYKESISGCDFIGTPLSSNVLQYNFVTHLVYQEDGSSFSIADNVNSASRTHHNSR